MGSCGFGSRPQKDRLLEPPATSDRLIGRRRRRRSFTIGKASLLVDAVYGYGYVASYLAPRRAAEVSLSRRRWDFRNVSHLFLPAPFRSVDSDGSASMASLHLCWRRRSNIRHRFWVDGFATFSCESLRIIMIVIVTVYYWRFLSGALL